MQKRRCFGSVELLLPVWLFLAILGCFASETSGVTSQLSYDTMLTSADFPNPDSLSVHGDQWYDIYADQEKDVFFLLLESTLFRYNYNHTTLLDQAVWTCCAGGYDRFRLRTDFVSDGWLFLLEDSKLLRFNMSDLTDLTEFNYYNFLNNRHLEITFDTARRHGYIIHPDGLALIVDIVGMTNLTMFNYSAGADQHIESFSYDRTRGAAPAFDSDRMLFWVGTHLCVDPYPIVVWQWDLQDIHNPVLLRMGQINRTCVFMQEGFIEKETGTYIYWESQGGKIGSLDKDTMLPSAVGWMETDEHVYTYEYVSEDKTIYWTDSTVDGHIKVYRNCPLENSTRDIVEFPSFETIINNIRGTFWDAEANTLWTVGTNNKIYTFLMNGRSDCVSSDSSSLRSHSFVLTLLHAAFSYLHPLFE